LEHGDPRLFGGASHRFILRAFALFVIAAKAAKFARDAQRALDPAFAGAGSFKSWKRLESGGHLGGVNAGAVGPTRQHPEGTT
jgi:hypothetical protein